MKTTTAQVLTVATILSATVGCQSGPQGWAWWKSKATPADSSAVARSAEPQLPTAQASPPVEVPGLKPAASPSSANLAAAGTTGSAGISLPASSPSTITNAPLANYTSTDAAAEKLTAPGTAAPAAPYTPTASSLVAGSTPPSGPYDPSSYKPSASVTANASTSQPPATPDRYQADGDRYGITPVGSTSPLATHESPRGAGNVPDASTASTSQAGNRYGLTSQTTVAPTANSIASQPPYDATVMAPATPTVPASTVAPATVATLTAPTTAPLATATVQTNVAGQYRPGGTSSYLGSIPLQTIEVATRPAPAATTTPATQSTAPAYGSIPWTPAGTTSTPTGGTGTQRY